MTIVIFKVILVTSMKSIKDDRVIVTSLHLFSTFQFETYLNGLIIVIRVKICLANEAMEPLADLSSGVVDRLSAELLLSFKGDETDGTNF